MSRCNKTVSFNLSDPDDLALFNHAIKINPLTGKSQNFSKYVKRLIENDIMGITRHIPHQLWKAIQRLTMK